MAGTIFDTSVYINALRRRDLSVFAQTRIADEEGGNEPLYLSAVVLEELYVGAINDKLKKLLAKYERRKYGFETVRRARMTNDCLIAMTAARHGLTVITHHATDFQIIAEFRPFKWKEIKI